jgi:hypothetical protein
MPNRAGFHMVKKELENQSIVGLVIIHAGLSREDYVRSPTTIFERALEPNHRTILN